MTYAMSSNETRDGDTWRATIDGYCATVQDLDGDLSEFSVDDNTGTVIAHGKIIGGDHFEAAKAAAWAAMLHMLPCDYTQS